jgi:hypothetical protein
MCSTFFSNSSVRGKNAAPEEGNVDFPWKSSQTEAEEHMRRIAEVIIRSNPDIINLFEVENLQALGTFNTKFLAGRGYVAYLVNGPQSKRRRLAAGGNHAEEHERPAGEPSRLARSRSRRSNLDAGLARDLAVKPGKDDTTERPANGPQQQRRHNRPVERHRPNCPDGDVWSCGRR